MSLGESQNSHHHHHHHIIIIRHELGLYRPVSASSNSLFRVLPSRLRPSVLQFSITFGILLLFILVTCCCSYLLHVAAIVICIFLVSRQPILLSALPKFLHSCCGQKVCILPFFWNFHVDWCQSFFLSFCLRVQIFASVRQTSQVHKARISCSRHFVA